MCAEFARPHAGAVDDDVGLDRALLAALLPGDAGNAAVLAVDLRHLHALDNLGAALPRAFGKRHGDVGGIALAVERQVDGADHVRNIQMRIHLLDFARRNLTNVDIEGARQRCLPVDLVLALLGQRHGDRAHLAHAGGDVGLGFQLHIEVGRVFRQPRHVLRAAQLADQAGRVPGGAGGELLALQQHDVGPAELGQMIGDRAAGNAAADDDGAGLCGERAHAALSLGSMATKRFSRVAASAGRRRAGTG